MNTNALVSEFALLLATHKIEYSQLDVLLTQRGIIEKERENLKVLIDNEAQQLLLSKADSRTKKIQFIQGILLFSMGIVLTFITWLNDALLKDLKVVVVFLAFIGYGGFLLFKATRKEEEKEPDPKVKMKRYFEKE